MSIFTRMFGSTTDHAMTVQPSGLLEDDGGWYCEESQDYSSSQQTIRIEQDRPGDWYVRDSFCEVDGLNDADRADDVAKFFAGSYRWLHLERRLNGRNGRRTIAVIGTSRGPKGKQQRNHLGFIGPELAGDLGAQDVKKCGAEFASSSFPAAGAAPNI